MLIQRLRTAFRLARAGLHLSWGCLLVASLFPWLSPARRGAMRKRWSRQLLSMLGVRLRAQGTPRQGALLVANHVSWLDIYAINAVTNTRFVCKAEVRDWPLIGWLVAKNDALFITRNNRHDARRLCDAIAASLRAGDTVVVFPEGTSSDGRQVLPFHGALFQAAIDAGCGVQPASLRYLDGNERPTTAPAYCGDITMLDSLIALARASRTIAEVTLLEHLATDCDGVARQALAARARGLVTSRLALPPADTAPGTRRRLPDAPPSGSHPTDSPCPAPADCPST